MSARNCPNCQRDLPVATLRALEQGVACPFCATRLKSTPRRASAAAPTGNGYAALQVSQTPPVIAQGPHEDSFRWFQSKGSPVAAAATAPPALPRSLPQLPTVGATPGPMPSTRGAAEQVRAGPAPVRPVQALPGMTATMTTAATEVAKRPVSLDAPPPVPPVEQRRAPTMIGTPAAAVAKPSPSAPVEKSSSPAPAERRSPPAPAEKRSPPAPVEKMSPPATVEKLSPPAPGEARPSLASVEKPVPPPALAQSPISRTPAEQPQGALAMTAVLPSAGSTLALAAPAMAFPLRSRRNMAIAVGLTLSASAVAVLVLHRAPADRLAPIAVAPPAMTAPPGGSAPIAMLHETSRPPAIQPLRPDTDRARASAEARPREAATAGVERDAPATATPTAHAKAGATHRATARERRQAKQERHAKRARHERRNTPRMKVASRATPSPADEGEARATYQRGNALLFAGDAAGAVAAYRKAVQLAPTDPIGYRGLGLAYEQKGETGAALRALRKYLKLAPGAADREIISRRIARLGHAASR